MNQESTRDTRSIPLLEFIAVAILLAAVALTAFFVISNRNRERARGEIEASLERAANAAEKVAAGAAGDYSLLEDEGIRALEDEGFEPSGPVQLSVISASSSRYCLKASHPSLGGSSWQAATYDSTDRSVDSADDC